jgi:hypothetical protein
MTTTLHLSNGDIHLLSRLGIINKDKAIAHNNHVNAMASDRRRRYDHSKPDSSQAIDAYYAQQKAKARQELAFLLN